MANLECDPDGLLPCGTMNGNQAITPVDKCTFAERCKTVLNATFAVNANTCVNVQGDASANLVVNGPLVNVSISPSQLCLPGEAPTPIGDCVLVPGNQVQGTISMLHSTAHFPISRAKI